MPDKYKKLKEILEEHNYPMVYPFKLIIKEDKNKLVRLKRLFEETAEISVKESRNGKYKSITVKQMMLNADDIISIYQKIEKIEGVINL